MFSTMSLTDVRASIHDSLSIPTSFSQATMLFLHSLPTFFLYLSFLDIFCVDAAYTLVDNFSGPSLLSGFSKQTLLHADTQLILATDFRTAADPTHGFVR
jgi:hypothetical protein